MRVLVTGGAGFVGRRLCSELVLRGYTVRVLDSMVPQVHDGFSFRSELPGSVEFIQGALEDPTAVAAALGDVDMVLHQAAAVGVGQSMYEIPRFVASNCGGTANLLQEIVRRRPQIRKLVVASSMTLYGEGCGRCETHGVVEPALRNPALLAVRSWEPQCPHCGRPLEPAPTSETKLPVPTSVYAVTKRDQEELCLTVGRSYEIPTTALRYFNIYGPGQTLTNPYTGVVCIFISRLLAGQPVLIFEDGQQSRDFVHVSDIVQANILALESTAADYEIFNVSSGELWRLETIANMVRDAVGVGGEIQVTGQYRAGDIRHCHADISKIRSLLGYQPLFGLERGLPEVVAWALTQQTSRQNLDRANEELAARGLLR